MPINVYKCAKCSTVREVLLPIEKIRRKCLFCGGTMERALHLEGIQIDGETVTGKKLL